MAIFLTNDDVRKLLPMNECIDVLEDLFQQEAAGLVRTWRGVASGSLAPTRRPDHQRR